MKPQKLYENVRTKIYVKYYVHLQLIITTVALVASNLLRNEFFFLCGHSLASNKQLSRWRIYWLVEEYSIRNW